MSERETSQLLPLLHSIAYNIVRKYEDAQDIVHDTIEKWLKIKSELLVNNKAYLIQAVKNNSIQFLKNIQNKNKSINHSNFENEEFLIEDETQERKIYEFDVFNQLLEAFKILNSKLNPIENKIFILREAFNFDYEELQEIFNKKNENIRQIFSRAKNKLKQEKHFANFNQTPMLKIFDDISLPTCLKELFTTIKNKTK